MSADRVRAYIALGANLGDSAATLKTVLDELRQTPGIAAVTASRFYRTAPVEATGPDFVNAAAGHHAGAAGTAGRAAGPGTAPRPRAPYKNAPRTLDLDMLLHGDQSSKTSAWSCPIPACTCAPSCCVRCWTWPPLRVAGRPAADWLADIHDQPISPL